VHELDHISIQGASEHNLKHVDVIIPKKKLVVVTGVSGSGKSSLAFDTLYAEGQRRYVESLSAYARQFLGQMDKPRYETIRGLAPTISIEQKTTGTNPRSTVGTITEIADYLRVLYARTGKQHCHQCGQPVHGQSAEQIARELARLPEGSRLLILVRLLENRKGEHRELLEECRRDGWIRLRVDGELVKTEDVTALDKRSKHTVDAVVDRISVNREALTRLNDAVEAALKRGNGTLRVLFEATGELQVYSQHLACDRCGISFPELSPQCFSFNNPQGMCSACNGLGTRTGMDPKLIIPDESKSIDDGAIAPWGEDVSEKKTWDFRSQILEHLAIDTSKPWRKLPEAQRQKLLWGTGDKRFEVTWKIKTGQGKFQIQWEGLIPRLMRRFHQTNSERARQNYAQFMADAECSECNGTRLRKESAAVKVAGHSIVQVSQMTVLDLEQFFANIELSETEAQIATEVLKELRSRIGFLSAVGLGYLSLGRAGPSLSGGEAQRIRLASQVGSELTGVIYVLDEPSIGLHQRDNRRLLDTLLRMRDIGNTVVCVEHDEETIREADHIIDFGPGAGVRGGEVVYAGDVAGLERCERSLTGGYLSGRLRFPVRTARTPKGYISLHGVRENNLKNLDVRFPLGVLTAVTGVSGAGKSTLVRDVLCPALARKFGDTSSKPGAFDSLQGAEQLDRMIDIDQRSIGRTPRSNAITYIKVFDEIRNFFAALPDARVRGYAPGRFSFNVKGGRCEGCEGDGVRKIEMHFLADVYVRCEQCAGKRYNQATLEVRYKGKSIADVLELTVQEALELFAAHPNVRRPLDLLHEVGLDYLPLGQPSPTLSGGEAQRIKLARELSKRATGRTFYVLDEPTTGLHFDDIKKLLDVLHKLVDAGNTVLVIEHNLDVIRSADHVIDLGPEGGPAGGQLLAEGPPLAIARNPRSHTGRYLAPLFPADAELPAAVKAPTPADRPRTTPKTKTKVTAAPKASAKLTAASKAKTTAKAKAQAKAKA
jgi:excinuclease ABC subunit A